MSCISRLKQFCVILGLLLMAQQAFARVVDFSVTEFRRGTSFQKEVEALQPGDEVRIIDGFFDVKVKASFKLLALAGDQGELGRVFKAQNENGEIVAIKFQNSDSRSRDAMKQEATALQALDSRKIPIAQMKRVDTDLYIEKEFIQGKTLGKVLKTWDQIPEQEANEILRGLADLYEMVSQPGIRISDLHAENIMWDENAKVWKIVDPGSVGSITKNENTLALSNAINNYPQFRDAFEAVRSKRKELTARVHCISSEVR